MSLIEHTKLIVPGGGGWRVSSCASLPRPLPAHCSICLLADLTVFIITRHCEPRLQNCFCMTPVQLLLCSCIFSCLGLLARLSSGQQSAVSELISPLVRFSDTGSSAHTGYNIHHALCYNLSHSRHFIDFAERMRKIKAGSSLGMMVPICPVLRVIPCLDRFA